MRTDLRRSSLLLLAATVALGVLYPLVMTGLSQVLFAGRADGSLIRAGDRVVGSTLLAADVHGDPALFHPRPSATGYAAAASAFANRGPNQRSTRDLTRQHIRAYLAAERPYDPGLQAADVPIDAATFSASGVDPDISPANAAIQARRVAAVRHLSPARVRRLIAASTDGRALGVFGERAVDVVRLNRALREAGR